MIHRLAERTGAEAYVMPVPFFANTVEDRDVLFNQRGVREIFDLASSADLLLVGIGTVEREASLVATGMIEKGELEEIKKGGGAGELLGHFFDDKGQPIETSLSNRTFTLSREALKKPPHGRRCRRQGQGSRHSRRAGKPVSERSDHRRENGADIDGGGCLTRRFPGIGNKG